MDWRVAKHALYLMETRPRAALPVAAVVAAAAESCGQTQATQKRLGFILYAIYGHGL